MRFVQFIAEADNQMVYRARVDQGTAREARIMDAMTKNCKLKVRPASVAEDKNLGIDCYVNYMGKDFPTQIKYRQTGEDIGYELYADIHTNKPGRDTRVKAELYAFVINGNLTLIRTADVKTAIDRIKMMFDRDQQRNVRQNVRKYDLQGVNVEVRIQEDKATGAMKVMVYIPTEYFTDLLRPVFQCRVGL